MIGALVAFFRREDPPAPGSRCAVCRDLHTNTVLCDDCVDACVRSIGCALDCTCIGCRTYRAAMRALLPTDLTVCDLPEVRVARRTVLS